ncbi:MAG: DUF362 domain-containing protein [Firmicutes bacterium]|nr:DUF362 domain-containing protein [Bacillota bacterium]
MAEPVWVNRCRTYDRKEISAAVAASFDGLVSAQAASGLRGSRVLVKPNLLGPSLPARAVTTHPEFVRSVLEVLKQFTPHIVAGDSPGWGSCAQAAEGSGVADVCRELGVALGSFNDPVEIRHPDGRVCKKFLVAREVAEADVVINLPKLKTHRLTGLSCAVKNVFGCVPGLRKAQSHVRMQDTGVFSAMLVDLCEAVRPALTLVDAVVAMEGNGPRWGKPREAGVVIAAVSPYAADVVASEIAGMDPSEVTTIAAAAEAGLGPAIAGEIDLRGLTLDEARVRDFKKPSRRGDDRMADSGRRRPLSAWLKRHLTEIPDIAAERCRKCSVCVEVCPARAISGAGDGCPPVIDHSLCVRCYCCEEMCPHGAVDVRRPLLSRIMQRF